MAMNQEELLDAIGGMTVLELSQFVDAFKEKFNVSAAVAAPVAVAADGAIDPAAAEEKTEFDVIIESIGPQKIQVIKVVRSLTSLGLKEAKALVDGAANEPGTVREAVSKDEAEQMKAKLEEAGATVALK